MYSTLHSSRTTHTHARPALCTRAQTVCVGNQNSVSSLCTLRLVLRRGPGFHLQRVYPWHLLRENVMHPASWWQAMVSISGSEACVRAWDTTQVVARPWVVVATHIRCLSSKATPSNLSLTMMASNLAPQPSETSTQLCAVTRRGGERHLSCW